MGHDGVRAETRSQPWRAAEGPRGRWRSTCSCIQAEHTGRVAVSARARRGRRTECRRAAPAVSLRWIGLRLAGARVTFCVVLIHLQGGRAPLACDASAGRPCTSVEAVSSVKARHGTRHGCAPVRPVHRTDLWRARSLQRAALALARRLSSHSKAPEYSTKPPHGSQHSHERLPPESLSCLPSGSLFLHRIPSFLANISQHETPPAVLPILPWRPSSHRHSCFKMSVVEAHSAFSRRKA